MIEAPSPLVTLLDDERGQSWVETVVMLVVIVPLLLGLFYLHDLVMVRMRAIQAARFVAWESDWYGREDQPNRAMKIVTQTDWIKRLKKIGLDGVTNVDVFKRRIGQYSSDVGDGVQPTLFLPCPLSNVLPGGGQCGTEGGTDQSQGFINGIASGLSGVLNGLGGLTGPVAFVFQDAVALNTNWDNEANGSVYTARVIYKMGYTGFFQSFGTSTIVQRASILSHPYVLRRTNDDQEYDELLGDACSDVFSDTSGHVVRLWLFPQNLAVFPSIQGFGTDTQQTIGTVTNKLGSAGKCIISGLGALASGLDKILGSSLGFKMPDGTLKEYPELSMPTNTGQTSGNGSGGSLGNCQSGGGAMGSGTGFSGCP
jgi:hypothetical protein